MKSWDNIFKVIILVIIVIFVTVNAQLYFFCKQQRDQINTLSDQQKIEAKTDSNEFKYQQDQIEHLSKDLTDTKQHIQDQDDALSEQKDEGKNIQTSLVDIKAETDAIKQDMKEWQKDYVSVLAGLEKKMDDSSEEMKDNIKSLKEEIETMSHPPDNTLLSVTPAPDKKIENAESDSQ